MKKTLLSVAMVSTTLISAPAFSMSDTPAPAPVDESVVYPAADTKVRFIAVGDTGTGKDGQYKVAAAIKEICDLRGCDFAIGMGDNVYEDGVDGQYDIQFETKFEQPYKNLQFPFYMSLGNHDNTWLIGGDGTNNDRGEAQVEYHYRTDRMSDKWQMPARHYQFNAPAEGTPLVTFFSLDTNPMASAGDPSNEYNKKDSSAEQGAWFKEGHKNSTAPWKIAYGHHPYISNGKHGNAGNYDGLIGQGKYFRDMMEDNVCGNADVLFTGHDHDLQWLKATESCPDTFHILTGAGAKTRAFGKANRNAVYWQKDNVLGFFHVEIQGDEFRGTAYTVDATSGEIKAEYSRTMQRVK